MLQLSPLLLVKEGGRRVGYDCVQMKELRLMKLPPVYVCVCICVQNSVIIDECDGCDGVR